MAVLYASEYVYQHLLVDFFRVSMLQSPDFSDTPVIGHLLFNSSFMLQRSDLPSLLSDPIDNVVLCVSINMLAVAL